MGLYGYGGREMDSNIEFVQGQPQRIRIYEGLKVIGNQLASFYLDGVRISLSNDFLSTTNIIGHIVREIAGGLTDIFDKAKTEKRNDVKIVNEISGILTLFHRSEPKSLTDSIGVIKEAETKLQDILERLSMQEGRNKRSVLNALGNDEENLFQNWQQVLNEVHKKAHRSGVWKDAKDPAIGKQLWVDFEMLLEKLVGTYTRMCDRIDRLVEYEEPSEEQIERISTILSFDSLRDYFFDNLKYFGWVVPLRKAGYFIIRPNLVPFELPDHPGSFKLPYWSELGYINRMAKLDQCEYKPILADIINEIVIKNSDNQRIDNSSIDYLIVDTIAHLPEQYISKEMINYIGLSLGTQWGNDTISATISSQVLPTLIRFNKKEMVCELLEKAISPKGNGHFDTILMDDYWLNEFINKLEKQLASLCGYDIAKLCLKNILKVISRNHYDYYFRELTKSDIAKLHSDVYDDLLLMILVRMIPHLSSDDANALVERLKIETHPIFKRLLIYVINKHFSGLSNEFWTIVNEPIDEEISGVIKELLKEQSTTYNYQEISKLIQWINESCFSVHDQYLHLTEKIQKYRKLWFFYALKESSNRDIERLIKEFENETKDLYADKLTEESSKRIDLNKKSLIEIIEIIKSEYINITANEEQYLIQHFSQVIEDRSFEVFEDLELFNDLPCQFKYCLIQLIERKKDKDEINWIKVLGFFQYLIGDGDFWNNISGENHNLYEMTKFYIVSILERMSTDNPLSVEENLLSSYENIISFMTEKLPSTIKIEDNHGHMLLGNNLVRMYSLALKYNFHIRNTSISAQHKHWARLHIKRHLSTNRTPELFAATAIYIHDLARRERDLMREICSCFPDSDPLFFDSASANYLIHNIYPNKAIYLKMKKLKFYDKLIEKNQLGDADKSLVFHIVYGYFRGWEENDSYILLDSLICSKDPVRLIEILWNLRVDSEAVLSNESQNKIKAVWNKVYFQVKEDADEKYSKVIANLVKPINGITLLDEDVWEILNFSVKYPKGNYQHYIIFCERYAEKEPKKVGGLFLKMLGAGYCPSYEEDSIRCIVETLFIKGEKELAIAIVDIYVRQGQSFLREIERKYI